MDIADIDAPLWNITLRSVSFLLSANMLAAYLGMQRPVGAFPTVDIPMKPSREDIFRTLQGRDVVVVRSFVHQNEMLLFWCIKHLIFVYDIESRVHTIECFIARGKLMLIVTRSLIVYLPLYIFMTLRSEVKTPSSSGLLYRLLLTQFLHAVDIVHGARLTTLEENIVLLDNTLKKEIITMRKDLTVIQEQMPDLKQFMTTTPTQLQTLTKQMVRMKELLEKIHEALGLGPSERAP
ncbi:hypothetical protein CJ030_MR6G024332 [Morella rubra]|uniref:Uncharacterized protein n=1 Tax=Morella rubra TaxID=262757 RepID=A0A6A1V8Z0_9ROSI|nr:hypothetical protein CJ030_MR8G028472 [Morella rubra]KAB1209270.1 hypothetical protein CJ030_MR6G007222 [Morella rubra]KAB1209284.1 hypothetical protein CJ030_MR6G024332 [Morella rubra]